MTGDVPTGRGLVCSPPHGYPYGGDLRRGDLDGGRVRGYLRGNGEPGRAYRYRGEAVIGDVLPRGEAIPRPVGPAIPVGRLHRADRSNGDPFPVGNPSPWGTTQVATLGAAFPPPYGCLFHRQLFMAHTTEERMHGGPPRAGLTPPAMRKRARQFLPRAPCIGLPLFPRENFCAMHDEDRQP